MKKMIAIAAVAAGLGIAGPLARAQNYVVNGHAASPAEAQLLASYGAAPGQWVIDGWGISAAASEQPADGKSATSNSPR